MTIIRVQKNRDNPYVQIDKRPLNDDRLSWKAKGILAYLLSKPDDWQIWVTDLVKRSKDGEHSVRMGLRELTKYGYASKRQEHGEDGKYKTVEWTVYERPLGDFPQAEKPHTEKPPAEKRKYTNNDGTKDGGETENDNTLSPNGGEKADPLLFGLDRQTLEAREREGQWTIPQGKDGLVSIAILSIYKLMESTPPKLDSGTWRALCNKLEPVLADHSAKSGEAVEKALALFKEDSPKTFNPWYKPFPGQFGVYLGKVDNDGQLIIKLGM